MPRVFQAAGLYFVALALLITPAVDVVVAALPFKPGEMMWRYGAVGILAEGVMTPLLGSALLLVIASQMEHPAVLKVVGVVTAFAGILLLAAVALFAVEFSAMRGLVPPEAQGAFGVASGGALFKHLTGVIGFGLLAVTSFKQAGVVARSHARRSDNRMVASATRATSG